MSDVKYKVEVQADSSGKWCANGQRWDSFEEAKTAATDLASRWLSVTRARVVSDDPVAFPVIVFGDPE